MLKPSTFFTIKEAVQITGVPAPTLRYYEELGLLDPVQRADNGHRRYTDADFERVDFIQSLKATGSTLREICHFIDLFRQGDSTLEIRRQLLEDQRKKVRQQMEKLREAESFIDRKIATYYGQADRVSVQEQEREEHVYIST